MKQENIWSEIRTNYTDEETGLRHIDAWINPDDDEDGKTIAVIDCFGVTTYKDERAKSDKYAQEEIQDAIREIEDERAEVVDKLIEQLKEDFRNGDYTVIDEILVHNVSLKILKASLSEDLS